MFAFISNVHAQMLQVTGMVSNAEKQPINGVTVVVKGTGTATQTDEKGNFNVQAGVSGSATLLFRMVGYEEKEIVTGSAKGLQVVLDYAENSLDEVVVIGYGTQRKKDLTGAVSQINAEKLENENPTSVQELLRANAAGLNVGYSASAKNEGSLQVRGRKSLTAGGTPLIVLDGVIYYGSLSDINPNDIETFDILKDASSAAVFGAKAANGVIMITTKRGKEGKTVINLDANYGIASMSVNQPIYAADGYLSHRENVMKSINENHQPYQFSDPRQLPSDISLDQWFAYDNSSGDPIDIWLQRLNMKQVEIDNYKQVKSIDWYDRVFQNGRRQDYTVNISNSKKELTYFWSLGYQNNEGIIVGDKFSVLRSRLNLEGRVTDFLSIGMNAQFSDRDESQVPVAWTQMVNVSPWGSEFMDDGVTLRLSPQDDPAVTANPFLNPAYTNRLQKYTNLTSIIFAKVSLPFGINYQVNFTPRFEWYKYLNHQSSNHPNWGLQGGMATRTQSDEFTWQLDNIFKWNKTIDDIHQFDVTMLINAEKFRSWRNVIDNNNFNPSDQLGYHNIGGGTNPIVSSDDQYSTGDALMGRIFYSLKDRYMLTLSLRRDGYSAFGQANPRATFPAAALGWVFTDEDFFSSRWFNYGKLRLSYGVNGNRDIGRYAALARLTAGDYLHVGSDGTVKRIPSLEITNMSNKDLQWEKTAAYNLGLDFSLWNDRISGSIEAYNMSTTDLLVERALPPITGFTSVMTNLGEVNNKGFEITLNTLNMTRENFSWNTSVNFSLNRNKIVHLYGDMADVLDENGQVIGQRELDDITNRWFIGRDIDEIWDLNVLGVYQEHEREEAGRYGVEPGDFKLEDVNQDGNYTDADRQFQGYTTPRFRWTLRNEFTFFKRINFSFMMYSNWGQRATFNEAKNIGNGYMDRTNAYILPYWTPDNPINDFARLSSSSGSADYDIYRRKSFIRLDNIAASYSVPNSLLNRTGLQALKVVLSVRNAGFYAPDMFLWDPENNGPTPRTVMLGINLTL
ncbi:SusC/RagA family TonB-linked outer membrane protein [Olivibacter sp. SDN3]|uniref:SusC/RagA family TonB-linked outer membrane protein n=1 Tax=Olivibacter sp. SDN3 TaxID=2764720 RepID=UPI001C9E4239|nr:SusC/RagA family TonB-linked outer membrane protein [Olivibacter sp. SDN3]